MDVAEADDRALRLGPRDRGRPATSTAGASGPSSRAGRPGRARRTATSGSTPDRRRPGHLAVAELALEPLDHPEAALDLDLEVARAGDRRRIGRDERDRLDVASVGRVDRRRRAVRQGPDRRVERARPRAPRRPCRRPRRSPAARPAARWPRRRPASARRGDRRAARARAASPGRSARPSIASRPAGPTPAACSRTARSRPGSATESTHRPTSRLVRKPESEQVAGGPRPRPRARWRRIQLASAVGLERRDRLADAERPEREARRAADRRQALGPALVEPDDRRPKRDRRPRRRRRPCARWVVSATPASAERSDGRLGEDPSTGLADRSPPDLGVLLGPAGLRRDVRLDRDPGLADDLAARDRRRAPGRSASRSRSRGSGRRRSPGSARSTPARSPEEHARVHHPVGIEPGATIVAARPSRARPSRRPGTGAWSRPTPCWWLIVPPCSTITWLAAVLSASQRRGSPPGRRRLAEDVGRRRWPSRTRRRGTGG